MKSKINSTMLTDSLARKVANRKLVEIRIRSLKPHPLEPPQRLKTDAPKFKELKSSIKEVGILNTVHFSDNTMHTFNGHRRCKIALDLGMTKVWAWRYFDLTEAEELILFKVLNGTTLSFSQKQEMHVYLEGGKVSMDTEKACANIHAVGQHDIGNGQKYVLKVSNSNKNQVTIDQVMTRFVSDIRKDKSFKVEETDIELKTMMFHYCLKVRSPFSLKNIMHERTASPVQLYRYVKTMKQLNIVTELVD